MAAGVERATEEEIIIIFNSFFVHVVGVAISLHTQTLIRWD